MLWRDGFCRIVLVDDPDYPGFCRVVLERHVKEMTDLEPAERTRLMNAVFATEAPLRARDGDADAVACQPTQNRRRVTRPGGWRLLS